MVKVLAIALAGWMAMTLAVVGKVGVYLLGSGVAKVEVRTTEPEGVHLSLLVPTGLIDLSLGVARFTVPVDEWGEVETEVASWWPLVETAIDQLTRCPEGTLVHVETAAERVWVSKTGRSFKVEVDAPEAEVRVSLPVRSLQRIARRVHALSL